MKKIYKIDADGIPMNAAAEAVITDAGYQLIQMPCYTSEEIVEKCGDASALIVFGENIDRDVLTALPNLQVVARCGVGVDRVDLSAATQCGVKVTNVPDANFEEVATHTMAMLLALTRRLFAFDSSTRKGTWTRTEVPTPLRRPQELVLGVIGGGRIGFRVVEMARSIGFQVLVNTMENADQQRATSVGASAATFDELIEQSDVVTLHVPLTPSTRGIISRSVIDRMKEGSSLINVSRGGLVDEVALVNSLESGHLLGAALDVFENEPLVSNSELARNRQIILTPHIAYLSEDSTREVMLKAAQQAVLVLEGKLPRYPVN